MKPIKLTVKTNSENYPIIIGSNIIKNISNLFKKNLIKFERALLIIDKNVPTKMIFKIKKSLSKKEVYLLSISASEKNKNQHTVNLILENLLKKNFSRQDCLISVGGGITGDISGFAASLYKRGLQFINIPTTLLSQVDSSVGGKTGINTKYGKNLIGSFYQPKIVLSDIDFLKSLPRREIICGYGEILKHSLIANKNFYIYLKKNINNILNLKSPYVERAIYKSCDIKKMIVQKDEKEKKLRKILNFGHTFAHSYEATLKYSKKLNHGEAVILGMVSALKFSYKKKLINKSNFESIYKHIKKSNLPFHLKNYFSLKDLNKIIKYMLNDKKNTTNKINLILLEKISKPLLNKSYNKFELRSFLQKELMN